MWPWCYYRLVHWSQKKNNISLLLETYCVCFEENRPPALCECENCRKPELNQHIYWYMQLVRFVFLRLLLSAKEREKVLVKIFYTHNYHIVTDVGIHKLLFVCNRFGDHIARYVICMFVCMRVCVYVKCNWNIKYIFGMNPTKKW